MPSKEKNIDSQSRQKQCEAMLGSCDGLRRGLQKLPKSQRAPLEQQLDELGGQLKEMSNRKKIRASVIKELKKGLEDVSRNLQNIEAVAVDSTHKDGESKKDSKKIIKNIPTIKIPIDKEGADINNVDLLRESLFKILQSPKSFEVGGKIIELYNQLGMIKQGENIPNELHAEVGNILDYFVNNTQKTVDNTPKQGEEDDTIDGNMGNEEVPKKQQKSAAPQVGGGDEKYLEENRGDLYWIKGNSKRYKKTDDSEKKDFKPIKARDDFVSMHLGKMADVEAINRTAREAWLKEGVSEKTKKRWAENEKKNTNPKIESDPDKDTLGEEIKRLEEKIDNLQKIIEELVKKDKAKEDQSKPKDEDHKETNPEVKNNQEEGGLNKEQKDQHVKDYKRYLEEDGRTPGLTAAEKIRHEFANNTAKYAYSKFNIVPEDIDRARKHLEDMPRLKRALIYAAVGSVAAIGVAAASAIAAPLLGVALGSSTGLGLMGMFTWPGLGMLGAKVVGGIGGHWLGRKLVDNRFWGKGTMERTKMAAGYDKAMRAFTRRETFAKYLGKIGIKAEVDMKEAQMQKLVDKGYFRSSLMPAVASVGATVGAGTLYHNWDTVSSMFSSPTPPPAPAPIGPGGAVGMGWPTTPVGANGATVPLDTPTPITPAPTTTSPLIANPPAADVQIPSQNVAPEAMIQEPIAPVETSAPVPTPEATYTPISGAKNISDGIELFAKQFGINPDASSIGQLSNGEHINLLTDAIRDQQRVALGNITTVAQNGLIDSDLNFLKDSTAINAMRERLESTVTNPGAINQAIADLNKLHEAAKGIAGDITIHVGR